MRSEPTPGSHDEDASLPLEVRESLVGYIAGAIELTGARDVRVVTDDADPLRVVFTASSR